MTLRNALRRVGESLLEAIETVTPPPPRMEPPWVALRRHPSSIPAAKLVAERSMRELEDAMARMERLRASAHRAA